MIHLLSLLAFALLCGMAGMAVYLLADRANKWANKVAERRLLRRLTFCVAGGR